MKNQSWLWVSVPFVIAVLGFAFMPSEQASARQAGARTSHTIAVLDINKVLDSLDEKSQSEQQLQDYIKTLEDRVNQIKKDADTKQAELDVLPKNDPAYEQALEELVRLSIRYESEAKLSQSLAEGKKKRLQLELFAKITDATKRFAEREGFLLVITDDSPAEITPTMSATQVQAAIIGRRVVYAHESIDISEEVAGMMNNEYKARGGGSVGQNSNGSPTGRAPR